MTPYAIALFVHVVGALGLFTAMGVEWVLLARLSRVQAAEEARDWLSLLGVVRRLSPPSLAAILLAGIYMMVTVWGAVAWIVVAFVALLLLPPLGILPGLRLPGIQRELAETNGPLSPALQQRLAEPLFLVSIQIRTAIALGIVFLMTVKPDALGSALAIAVAILLGIGGSLPVLNRARGRASQGAPSAWEGSQQGGVPALEQMDVVMNGRRRHLWCKARRGCGNGRRLNW